MKLRKKIPIVSYLYTSGIVMRYGKGNVFCLQEHWMFDTITR